jgi:type VI secretion system secreted protein Hcp
MFNAFLEIEGIEGESLDDRHRRWVEIFSYSHGITQEVSEDGRGGGGRRAGKSEHDDFVVVKALDKTSPLLALACCKGERIRRVKLDLCRSVAGGERQSFMEYKLNDVMVTSVRPCGSTEGEDDVPYEEVSFKYGKIKFTYTELDHETGESKGEVKTSWDVRRNTEG